MTSKGSQMIWRGSKNMTSFTIIGQYAFCSALHILSLIPQVQDADGAQDLQLTAGQVEFDRVSFSYVPGCVANMMW